MRARRPPESSARSRRYSRAALPSSARHLASMWHNIYRARRTNRRLRPRLEDSPGAALCNRPSAAPCTIFSSNCGTSSPRSSSGSPCPAEPGRGRSGRSYLAKRPLPVPRKPSGRMSAYHWSGRKFSVGLNNRGRRPCRFPRRLLRHSGLLLSRRHRLRPAADPLRPRPRPHASFLEREENSLRRQMISAAPRRPRASEMKKRSRLGSRLFPARRNHTPSRNRNRIQRSRNPPSLRDLRKPGSWVRRKQRLLLGSQHFAPARLHPPQGRRKNLRPLAHRMGWRQPAAAATAPTRHQKKFRREVGVFLLAFSPSVVFSSRAPRGSAALSSPRPTSRVPGSDKRCLFKPRIMFRPAWRPGPLIRLLGAAGCAASSPALARAFLLLFARAASGRAAPRLSQRRPESTKRRSSKTRTMPRPSWCSGLLIRLAGPAGSAAISAVLAHAFLLPVAPVFSGRSAPVPS